MSNGRRNKRAALRWVAEQTNAATGCTCRPDTRIVGADHVAVYHDDGCPAIVGRLYVVLAPGTGPDGCRR